MISLLRAEFRRATSRRLVRFGVAATLVAIVVAGIIVAVNSHGSTPSELARANEDFHSSVQLCRTGHFIKEKHLPPNTTLDEWCAENVHLEQFVPDHRFELFGLPGILVGVSPLLVLGALLIGASLVGVVLAILLQVVLSLVLGLVASTRGSTVHTGGDWQHHVAGTVLRVGGASAIASLIGLSIAMLGRNTAAALGVGFAYLGVLEGLIRGLRPAWQPWLLGDNVAVFVSGHVTQLGLPPGDVTRTVGAAAMVAFGYAAILLLAAGTGFRLRDVQ
jgi:hypothetical protein